MVSSPLQPPAQDKDNCAGCAFWKTDDGECHRLPPTVQTDGVMSVSVWPTTNPTDWCGEFWSIATALALRGKVMNDSV